MNITSGQAEILYHGTVTSFGGAPIRMDLSDELGLIMVFTYTSDPEREDLAARVEFVGQEVRFELVNFDGADGRGSATPVLLGEVGDYAIFLHFRSFLYGKTVDHTLHYTLYKARKEDVSWSEGE